MTALGSALLAAASLPSCLIPEPDANHNVSEASSSPTIFTDEPGPASEPDLGLPPAPPLTAAPAQPAAEPTPVGADPQSSASSAAQTETAAPAPSEATASSTETGTEIAHSSSTQPPPDQQQPGAQGEPQGEPRTQEPAPPDLPTEPATAAGDNANPPALANAPKEVLDLLDRYYAAFSTGQWTVAAQCFWEGATFTSVRSPGNGEPAQVLIRPAREVFDEFISGKRALESVEGKLVGKPQVLRTGDVSHAWCRYEAKYGTPTDAMSWRRIDSVTLVLHEDVWKIACLVQSRSVDLP